MVVTHPVELRRLGLCTGRCSICGLASGFNALMRHSDPWTIRVIPATAGTSPSASVSIPPTGSVKGFSPGTMYSLMAKAPFND